MGAPESVRLREEAAAMCAEKSSGGHPGDRPEKPVLNTWRDAAWSQGRKKAKRKPLTELYVSGTLPKTEQNGKKNFKGIVKRCTPA